MHKVNSPADLPPGMRVFHSTNYDDIPTIPIPRDEAPPTVPGQVGASTGPEHDFPFDIIGASRHQVTIRTRDGHSLTIAPDTLELKHLWGIAPIQAWGREAIQDLRYLVEAVRSEFIQVIKSQEPNQETLGPKPWELVIPETSWLVENFFPAQGLVGIIGASGAKKTYLTLDLALSVATQKPFLGEYPIDEPGGVLWISPEGRLEQNFRILAWCKTRSIKPKELETFYVYDEPLVLPTDGWKLLEVARKVSGLRLLVIDPLIEFLGSQDENNNALIASVLASIQHVVDTLGILAVVTHHTGHGQERGRGGSAFRGKLDREFLIKPREDGSLILEPTKVRGFGFPPHILVGFELVETGYYTKKGKPISAGVLSYQGEAKEEKDLKDLGANQKAIVEWLEQKLEQGTYPNFEQTKSYFTTEWGQDKVRKHFKRTLDSLIKKNLVIEKDGKLYTTRFLANLAKNIDEVSVF